MTSGTPTAVYALVAQGALGCWFGANGRLKATHVFQAEAEPPAAGGMAEIILHERDETLRDKRGTRAVRIGFSAAPAGTQVRVAMIKMEPQLAQVMTRDVEVWAGGGSGCQTGKLAPPEPPAPAASKGKAGRPAGKKL